MNSSVSTPPIDFRIYGSLGLDQFALVVCVFVFYISGLCVNVVLVVVVCVESRLHRPMYVLLVNLSLSGLMGSSSVCPIVLRHLVSGCRETSLTGCLTQVFFTNVYAGCMFCILALMAYDRYVSICKPLLYHSIMTPVKVTLMLTLVYVSLSCSSAVQVYLTSSIPLCEHAVDKLICDSLVISKLSCKRTTLISVFGLCCAVCVIIFPCVLVLLSYLHIFKVTLRSSPEGRRRALQTCAPHLLTFLNFSVASFFGVVSSRLTYEVPKAVNIFICMNFFAIPPLLHPIIYGIKMKEIRQSLNKMIKDKILQLRVCQDLRQTVKKV
ncbi:odorant receptor, family 60, subfamily A, member 1 [Limanda limanda]|uniref:odorant receptor, family 60, subfamily A, member 1 n=1 Tax=Limanda limanda TaxID=27771 RepID=UPI0029C6C892|nr:odorant receptor, family 60, subfamily A, member 1 [Limanda limanda]